MITWKMVSMEGNPEFGVDLQPFDFMKFAEAAGVAGFTIEDPREAASTLERALQHPGPAIVEAMVDPNEPPLPPKLSRDELRNISEAVAKGQPDGLKIALAASKQAVRQVI